MLPKITEYHQAISNPESFKTLSSDIDILTDENGELIFASGNFAVVYKVLYKNQFYAIKCFLKEQEERVERLEAISDYIKHNKSEYWVQIDVFENELWVDVEGIGRDYTVVLMPWITAPTLGNILKTFIEKNDIKSIQIINENLKKMFQWILEKGFAHGDLKQDNILINDSTLEPFIIDYDGMFIPEFKGKIALELGSPCFQHPTRSEDHFDHFLDDFSMFIILYSLDILIEAPFLWHTYNHDQNIVFDVSDFSQNKNLLLLELEKLKSKKNKNYLSILKKQNWNLLSPQMEFREEVIFNRSSLSKNVYDSIYVNQPRDNGSFRSLFEKEEKEIALNQLKLDLISRFFPFEKEKIIKYKSILNGSLLIKNDFVNWDIDLIDELDRKFDWSELFRIKNIKFDLAFFKKYEAKIEFSCLHLMKNIDWSKELLSEFEDRFHWNGTFILAVPICTLENLRKYQDVIKWEVVSNRIKLEFTKDILEEFSDRWDWEKLSSNTNLPLSIDFSEHILDEFLDRWDWGKLSANPNLPLSIEFIQKYSEHLNFDAISKNPKALDLIYKFPTSKKWNWNNVILNSAINYDKESFDFVFKHYKMNYETKEFDYYYGPWKISFDFLSRIVRFHQNDISLFLQVTTVLPPDDFNYRSFWSNLSLCRTKLSQEFIEKHKSKLDFKNPYFISRQIDGISKEFVGKNLDLFDTSVHNFYYLPLTIDLLNKLNDKINWNFLSSNEKLDWTWWYLDKYFYEFNFYRLSENKGIFDRLIMNNLSNRDIFEFLDNEMIKKHE
jgi:hypothetical protein